MLKFIILLFALWKIGELLGFFLKEFYSMVLLYINHKKQQKKSVRRLYR